MTDPDRPHAVAIGDRVAELTPREAGVLSWLMAHPSQPVSRRTLLREVWGYRGGRSTRVVDMTVARLRRKIEPDPSSPTLVTTVSGVGYRFEPACPLAFVEPGAPSQPAGPPPAPPVAGLAQVVAQLGVFGDRVPRAAVTAVVAWPDETRELGPWGAVHALLALGLARDGGDVLIAPGAGDAFLTLPTAERRALAQRRARWAVSLRGDVARAWVEVIEGVIDEALVSGDLNRAREGLEALASCQAGGSPMAEARLALHEGRLLGAEQRFRDALPDPAALAGLGWSCNLRGDNTQAQRHYRALVGVASGALAVRANTDLAVCAIETGAADEAFGHLERASAHAASCVEPRVLADVLMTRGYLGLMLDDPATAEPAVREAEALYREMDEPRGVAWALNNLGEAQRLRGDRAAAARSYRQSLEWFRAAGCSNVIVPMANLGLLDLIAGLGGDRARLTRAVERFERVRAEAREQGRVARAGRSALLLARARWELGEVAAAIAACREAVTALNGTTYFERLIAREAEALGVAMLGAAPSEAGRLLAFAARQWRGLGRPEDAARAGAVADDVGIVDA
jgi:DNA-binding winged helix-turn-helix (wHTH) protein/tetratricopeptide (TPR) repeat protein